MNHFLLIVYNVEGSIIVFCLKDGTLVKQMPMGVLATGSAHARASAQPPIDMSESLLAHGSGGGPGFQTLERLQNKYANEHFLAVGVEEVRKKYRGTPIIFSACNIIHFQLSDTHNKYIYIYIPFIKRLFNYP